MSSPEHSSKSDPSYDDELSSSEENCFFADRMLDLEDAQAPTTPHCVSRKSSSDCDIYTSHSYIQETNMFELLQDATLVVNEDMEFTGQSRSSTLSFKPEQFDGDADGHAGLYASGAIKGSCLSLSSRIDSDPTTLSQQIEERLRASKYESDSEAVTKSKADGEFSHMNRIDYNSNSSLGIEMPSRLPTMPRDSLWGFTALVYIPLSIFLPLYLVHHNPTRRHSESSGSWNEISFSGSSQKITFWSTALAFVFSLFMCKWTFKSAGDESRKRLTSKISGSNVSSLIAQLSLICIIILKYPTAWIFAIFPVIVLAREVIVYQGKRHDSATGLRDGRIIFFHALASTALEILTRSLHRAAIYRLVLFALVTQFTLIVLWRSSILAALSISGPSGFIMVSMSILGGLWGSNIVSKILGLIASGGVSSWLMKQAILSEKATKDQINEDNTEMNLSLEEFSNPFNPSSPYRPIQLFDGSDDEVDDDNDFIIPVKLRENFSSANIPGPLKPVLISTFTISFGSVCMCAFFGSLTNLTETLSLTLDRILTPRTGGLEPSFQGMTINGSEPARHMVSTVQKYLKVFFYNYSDIGLPHVAMYFKSYRRSSKDVSDMIEGSGVRNAMYDDLTSTLCSSFCIGLSTWIPLIFYVTNLCLDSGLSDKLLSQSMPQLRRYMYYLLSIHNLYHIRSLSYFTGYLESLTIPES